jgi:DNA-binding transcriptional LysR family regulator
VTAPLSFGTIQLTPRLLDFARAFPDIQLDVGFSDRMVNLVEEGFDMAVRIGRSTDSSLITRKLCDARIVLVASPEYLVARGRPATLDDLAAHDCIIDTNFRDPFDWSFNSPKGRIAVTVTGRIRFSNGEACLAAAEAGLGIARVPSFIAGPRIREGRLVSLLPETEDLSHVIHAVYPPARHLALKVRVLVDFLANSFRGTPEWDREIHPG